METLSALRYCLDVATEREQSDRERSWQWAIRRKVLRWSIAQMERAAVQTPARFAPGSLSEDDQRRLVATHPLLRLTPPVVSAPFEPAAAWRVAISARVEKFIRAMKSRQ